VTPEPLLVDEEPQGPSNYGTRPQETTALHSYFSPASGDPALEGPGAPAHRNLRRMQKPRRQGGKPRLATRTSAFRRCRRRTARRSRTFRS
jgi:hypothetical protein